MKEAQTGNSARFAFKGDATFLSRVRWKVWRRFLRCRERDEKTAKQLFNEAYDSVAVSHAASALTWGNLYVTAREPEVAADVANAYMTALADLEMELLDERGNVDNRTNTMFKIMHKAEVPTAASGSDSRKRMEEFRRWFESAGDIPL